jgi:hypothetical protein
MPKKPGLSPERSLPLRRFDKAKANRTKNNLPEASPGISADGWE